VRVLCKLHNICWLHFRKTALATADSERLLLFCWRTQPRRPTILDDCNRRTAYANSAFINRRVFLLYSPQSCVLRHEPTKLRTIGALPAAASGVTTERRESRGTRNGGEQAPRD